MTYQAAVLGSPIEHSLSPRLHRAAYSVLSLDWDYTAIECDEETFPGFFEERTQEWMGLSLTMPVKEIALTVVSDVEPDALTVGSINTLYREGATPGARWLGANTDIQGMVQALHQVGVVSVRSAILLGAGATARSAMAALARLGAQEVRVHARRPQPRALMVDLGRDLDLVVRTSDLEPSDLDADLLVSTLPADAAAPWSEVTGNAHIGLLDASYHPWPSPLARGWQRHRPLAPVANGRDMLLWQAVAQVALMTGAFPRRFDPADPNARAVAEAMAQALTDES